jgi:hypothetical protein
LDGGIYLYFIIALISSAGILFYYLSYKSVKQPKTDILFTDALNAMVRGDKAKAIGILRLGCQTRLESCQSLFAIRKHIKR